MAIFGCYNNTTDNEKSMRKFILTLLLFIPFISYSQDLIILRNGEQINCKITKLDSLIVYYDFQKGERKLSSYIAKSKIRTYQINSKDDIKDFSSNKTIPSQGNIIVIDTSKYIKETNKWINLITYSQRYGLHANGWSVQYYGYNLRNTSKWNFPIIFGIEGFEINHYYFSLSNYESAKINYLLAGISPFYKLNDNFFLNIGVSIILGEEELEGFYGREISNTFFGISPSQGIYFIPKSNFGITLGISIYEKLMSSEVYESDFGLKLEIGIKF